LLGLDNQTQSRSVFVCFMRGLISREHLYKVFHSKEEQCDILSARKEKSMPAPCDRNEKRKQLENLNLSGLTLVGEIYREERYLRIRCCCDVCGEERPYHVDNLLAGKTRRCRCQRGIKYAKNPLAAILGERYDAIKQRCDNPRYQSYRDYGDRGIENRFSSREEFVRYMLELISEKYPYVTTTAQLRAFDIDRINNDGAYVKGNLRLVSPAENLRNTSRNRWTSYCGKAVVANDLWHLLVNDNPAFGYSCAWVAKLAASGLTGEEIVARAASRKTGGRKPTRSVRVRPDLLSLYGFVRRRWRSPTPVSSF
jgi:hypothetical protein